MRPGELLKLKWENAQWDRHKIVFPADVIKTKSRRPLTLLPVAEQTLLGRKRSLEAKGSRAEGFVFPAPGKAGDGKRSAGQGERSVKGNTFSQRFRRLFLRCVEQGLIEKEKGGERLVLYSSRHTRITELVVQGLPMKVVMDEAGHKIPTTTNRYTHLADEFVTETVRRAAETSAGEGTPGG